MFTKELVQAGHTKRVTITRGSAGWDVREERDNQIVRTANYLDWHRVERALGVFERLEPVDGGHRAPAPTR